MYRYSLQYLYENLVSGSHDKVGQKLVVTQKADNKSLDAKLVGNVNDNMNDTDTMHTRAAETPYLASDRDSGTRVEVSKDYTSDPAGREFLEKDYAGPIASAEDQIWEFERKRDRILVSSISVRLARYLEEAFLWPIGLLLVVLSVFCLRLAGPGGLIVVLLVGVLSFFWAIEGLPKLRRNLEERAARGAGELWISLENGIQLATENLKRLEAEKARKRTAIFDKWATYPPDMEYRRELAKERDNYSCTKCRYPEGFKRRSRQLHVHHKIPVSRGGTHELENLITLCHICHREVDASHSRVRRTPAPRRRRYR